MRVVLYNLKKNEVKIAERAFWRKNIYREVVIVSKKTDNYFIRCGYLSEKSWVYICDY